MVPSRGSGAQGVRNPLGDRQRSRRLYERLAESANDDALRARVLNDLGTLDALDGLTAKARSRFEDAVKFDGNCRIARENLALLDRTEPGVLLPMQTEDRGLAAVPTGGPIKIALLSFLFNWPSTGGGIVHTVELVRFLKEAGYDVRHFSARFAPWGIGRVEADCPMETEVLEFDTSHWNLAAIKDRYRAAVDDFAPDSVIITDAWNMKPHLADAVRDYPYSLRMQALAYAKIGRARRIPEEELERLVRESLVRRRVAGDS